MIFLFAGETYCQTLTDTIRAIPLSPLSILPASDCMLDRYENRKILSETQRTAIAEKRAEIDFKRTYIDSLYYVEAMLSPDNALALLDRSLLHNKFFIPAIVEKINILLRLEDWEKTLSFWKSSVDYLYHSEIMQRITHTVFLHCINKMEELNRSGNEQQTLELYELLRTYFVNLSYDTKREKEILQQAHRGIFRSYLSVAQRALSIGLENMAQNYGIKAQNYYMMYRDDMESDNKAKSLLLTIAARYRAFASLSDSDEKQFYLAQIDSIYSQLRITNYELRTAGDGLESVGVAVSEVAEASNNYELRTAGDGLESVGSAAVSEVAEASNNYELRTAGDGLESVGGAAVSGVPLAEDVPKAPKVPKVPKVADVANITTATDLAKVPEISEVAKIPEVTKIPEVAKAPAVAKKAQTVSPASLTKPRLTPSLKKQVDVALDLAYLFRSERKFYPAHLQFEKAYELYPSIETEKALKKNLMDVVEQLLNKAQYQLWNSKQKISDSLYREAVALCERYQSSTNAEITSLFINYLQKRNEVICRQFALEAVKEEKRAIRLMQYGKLYEGLTSLKRLKAEIEVGDCHVDTSVLIKHILTGENARKYYSLKDMARQNLQKGDTLAFIAQWLHADTLYLKGDFSEYVTDFKPLIHYLEQMKDIRISEKWMILCLQNNDSGMLDILMKYIAEQNPKSKVLRMVKKQLKR
ncbi:MAG: hypothetical protein LBQ31_02200 [Bacteroidales bacterium]|nr:hypothetical protein [Bacteroidales bacterium]